MFKRALVACAFASIASAAVASPYQFTARLYTEALGRAPDAGGWNQNAGYFTFAGCNKASLRAAAQGVYTSPEFNSLGYDSNEKVLTLYRGLLGREPDPSGFAYWVAYLGNGNSMASLVDLMIQSIDQPGMAAICAPRGYGWGVTPVLDNSAITAVGTGTLVNGHPITNAVQLQAALNAASPGATVYLPQRTVIVSTAQVVVPAGVTLATAGTPGRRQYAKQARIARGALFNAGRSEDANALVKLLPGAKLLGVWVTGQRQRIGYSNPSVNVYVKSGNGSSVLDSRIENAAGWAALVAHRENSICSNVRIDHNLVTGYTNSHAADFTDGISGTCEGATITGNDIVDPSDVGIVLFGTPGVTQASLAWGNTVVSAGVPAYGALVMDPLYRPAITGDSSFAGATFDNNAFWSAPDSHFDIGISLGTYTWFSNANTGTGGTAVNNNTAGIRTPMQVGIVVDGMVDAKVQANMLYVAAPQNPTTSRTYFKCRAGNVLVDMNVTSAHAAGSNMQPYASAATHDCIGHN